MATKKWSKEETFALLQQYERFSELWNITLPEHRNTELKMSKIKETLESLEISDTEITRKWHNLLSQICAELRKLKKKKVEEIFYAVKINYKSKPVSAVNYLVDFTYFVLSSEGAKCSKLRWTQKAEVFKTVHF